MDIIAARLTGRCANDQERGAGFIYHALPVGSAYALCGKFPGRHSAGWNEETGHQVTCGRCKAKVAKIFADVAQEQNEMKCQ